MVSNSLEGMAGMAAVLYVSGRNISFAALWHNRQKSEPSSSIQPRCLKFSGKSKSRTSEGGAFETYRI